MALEATDMMHYESRAIKAGLKASISRLAAAKGYIPSSLTPEQLSAHGVPQDWSAPKVVVDFGDSSPLGSGDARFEEMRACLLDFEHGTYQAATSKERAFYSALRTLLSDITVTKDDGARGLQIKAAHKWFTKHRPRGYSEDPSAFAAMAASLSLQGVQQAPRHSTAVQQHGSTRPFAAQGTKHEFFAIFSKDAAEVYGYPGSSQEPVPLAVRAPLAPARTSLMPVVMQPAVPQPRNSPVRDARRGGDASVSAPASSSAQEGAGEAAAGATVLTPQSRARVGFEGEQQEQQQGQQKGAQGKQTWNSGPFRDSGSHQTVGTSVSKAKSKANEAEEIEGLRRKWAAMDTASSKSVVDQQVQAWSQQRARLEEEIIRRQEASRYASPSMHNMGHLGPNVAQQAMAKADGYMSPYAGLVSHQMGLDSDTSPSTIPGLMLAPSVTATARDVRAKAQEQHSREVTKISRKLAQLGLQGAAQVDAVEHALAPVPDKAYLECLAKLPRPGDLLPSKPGSAIKTGTTTKKNGRKRVMSAGRTRA